jgi:hypothetical protein
MELHGGEASAKDKDHRRGKASADGANMLTVAKRL